jgi:hypothetical protein
MDQAEAEAQYQMTQTQPAPTEVPKMPPAIIKAIIGVMSEVKKLAKEGNNIFQRYKFTSVDQFYEALGPLMASHGLMDIALEQSVEVEVREVADDRGIMKKSAWLIAIYEFWLFHESGASYGPITRRIQVLALGPQSYASAQSFAEKYFLRNLFKVPTGDVDEVDASQQVGLPAPELINSEQLERLNKGLTVTKTDLAEFLKLYKVNSIEGLTTAQYQNAINFLAQKVKRMKKQEPEPRELARDRTTVLDIGEGGLSS